MRVLHLYDILHGRECRKTPKQDLPVSQLEPSYPMLQEHVYFSNMSVHIPPFLQGMLAHLSNSRIKLTNDEIMAAITTQG